MRLTPYLMFMTTIAKTTLVDYFSKSKVIFATIAAVITFSITMYNQFKGAKTTVIAGIVATDSSQGPPVDAVVQISSPIQASTETDMHGRFKFKLENLATDTFLIIVRNKRTNTVAKQNEYVNASRGRTDVVVLFDEGMRAGGVYTTSDTSRHYRRPVNIRKLVQGVQGFFH
jgi:hypothetical protein